MHEYIQYDPRETQSWQDIHNDVLSITAELYREIEHIEREKATLTRYLIDMEESLRYSVLEGEMRSIWAFSEPLFDMVEHKDSGIIIEIDTSMVTTLDRDESYVHAPFSESLQHRSAFKQGEELGVVKFLAAFAPDHITDPEAREQHFSLWPRSMFEKINTLHTSQGEPEECQDLWIKPEMNSDGSMRLHAETRSPYFTVIYTYPPGGKYPERALCLTKA